MTSGSAKNRTISFAMSAKSAAIHEITESKNETIVSFFLSFVVVVVVVVVSAKLKSINAVCVCLQVVVFSCIGVKYN